MIKKLCIIASAIFVLAVAGVLGWMHIMGDNKEFAKEGAQIVHVKVGMTTADIADMLHEKQLVKNPKAFKFEARFKGLANKLQAGMYKIEGGMSNGAIVNEFANGRIELIDFIVPEGFNVVKTGRKLESLGLGSAEKFIELAKNYAPYDYMKTDNPHVIFKSEGFLYPATYKVPYGASEEEYLHILVRHFNEVMEKNGVLDAVKKRDLNMRDVVNMAAMVEMEAVYAEEQPRIAGVFLKRVEIGMPIQSDTTIQYILGAQKETITFKDTEIDNPYNTYQNYGLPPGPIGSPSLSAIQAVLEPEQTDYLYFVAQNDGHHRFSRTYAEHLRAIDE
ncbi:MAG: endolytic transglycosylase MltG, partial [Phascolarctobacterium sp.]|nr:endolytic transglycosylase MltG [Phascolarctobacterium sp.]